MSKNMSFTGLNPLKFPQDGNDFVILEYIMTDYTRHNLQTRTYIEMFEPKSIQECPVRNLTVWESAEKKLPCPEIAFTPVAMCKDPFRQGRHKIVLCEANRADDKGGNIEFEFEINAGDNSHIERALAEAHMQACLYAGLTLTGMNREMYPSQWEYQVGPLPGLEACDQVLISRYILLRLAEMNNLKVTFSHPECTRNTTARCTMHMNFSTKETRQEGGLRELERIVSNVGKHPQEALLRHYDMANGQEMQWFLSGKAFMPKYDEFVCRIGDKDMSSIRIPTQVALAGKGYLEERRPTADSDPYDVCYAFTSAAFFEAKAF